MKGLLSWILLGCVGAISVVALILSCYVTYQTQSGNGSINVRSATINGQSTTSSTALGGSVVTTVIQSGSYNVRVNYFNPAPPFTAMQDEKTVGTYTLSTVQIQGDSAVRLVLELAPMSYTFSTTLPGAGGSNAQFQFRNFSNGGLPINGFGISPLFNPYTVTSTASGSAVSTTYKSMTMGTTSPDPTTFSMSFYPKGEATIPNGAIISTTGSIKFAMGTIEN